MKYKNKEYRQIPGYSRYYINKETAKVISIARGIDKIREMYPTVNRMGYYQYTMLNEENKSKSLLQHRLLMLTFVDNPNNYPFVNHIDGNKLNNVVDNLEWCTHQQNVRHAIDTGLRDSSYAEKEVHQYDICGNYITTFKSLIEASRQTGCSSPNILHYIQGDTPHAKGHLYSYTKEDKLPAYTGAPILKDIKIVNVLTKETTVVTSTEEASRYTKLHRSKFFRRFAKSLSFMLDEFHITRTNYGPSCSDV